MTFAIFVVLQMKATKQNFSQRDIGMIRIFAVLLILAIGLYACGDNAPIAPTQDTTQHNVVQDSMGQPLNRVKVLVIDKQTMSLVEQVQTDHLGRFRFSNSVGKDHALVAIAPDGLVFVSVGPIYMPVRIVLQSSARGKLTTTQLLGDVDGDGDIDQADALLLYAHIAINYIPSRWLAVADIDKDGSITLTDVFYIGSYILDPTNPDLPSGIGESTGIEIDESPPVEHPLPDSLGLIDYPDDPLQVEPGQTPQTAYVLQAVDAVQSQIAEGEFDYFRITLTDAAVILVRGYVNDEGGAIYFSLHDHTGTMIGDEERATSLYSENRGADIYEEVRAGTYFIRVKGSFSVKTRGSIAITDYSLYVADSNVISTGRWQLYTTSLEDQLGELRYFAELTASEGGYSWRRPILYLRCWQGETHAFVNWRESLGTSFLTNTREVSYRISDNDSVQDGWSVSTNEEAVFAPEPIEFIQSMIGEDTLSMRVWPRDGDPLDATFDITGVDAAILEIRNVCGW